MGKFNYSDGIAVLELIAYLPAFFVAAFLVFRHGIRTSGGFIFLVIFGLVRIVGAVCELVTINYPSKGVYIAAAICSSVGLSPLLMTCSGMLSRANESMPRPTIPPLPLRLFRIVTMVALALTVTGISWHMKGDTIEPNVEVKVGMILYLFCWFVLIAGLGLLFLQRSTIAKGENRNLAAVGVSAPFLLVRTVYAMLVWFLDNSTFSPVGGNNTVKLVLSVLDEIVVVFTCLAIGFTLHIRENERKEWKEVPDQEVEARELLAQQSQYAPYR
ncbi:hypothetical protein N7532_010015 [Penicillium argentinense]|uniref:DUF7702 domain-containing protein n=1 Tax=Penicillium argentinense TaxID=1131581 RepID=A0A9W9JX86_9EURO|nr:uncharacterized protein N7532_010015 [Penicillium argentinense]KAJ5085244.1 hypothetical protein N7532_010015 [Penicillium argentinense]